MRPNAEHEHCDRASPDGLNFHPTCIEAVRTLERMEGANLRRYYAIWEMACGDGAIVKPLRKAGYHVVASDIVDRGCPRSSLHDFLGGKRPHIVVPRQSLAGVTNPPFDRAEEFVLKACAWCDYVAMLLRLRWIAAQHVIGSNDTPVRVGDPLWQRTRIPFARLILPDGRWPMMHRDGYAGPKTESSMIDMAWFVWEAGHKGAPQILREPHTLTPKK